MPATVFFLWFSDEEKRANLVNKSGAICKFLSCVTATQPSMLPVIPFVLLLTNGCDESRLMANWLKGQKVEIERVLVSPFLRAEQTLEEVGDCLNLPSSAEVLPELTPCGDVGLVSADSGGVDQ